MRRQRTGHTRSAGSRLRGFATANADIRPNLRGRPATPVWRTALAGQAVILGLALLAGCDRAVTSPENSKNGEIRVQAADDVTTDDRAFWRRASDSSLWARITESDTSLTLGLKAPGAERGVVRGRPQLSHQQWLVAIDAVANSADVTVTASDSSHLPVVRLKPRDISALARIRHLPFVDYAEPTHPRISYFDSPDGCASGGSGDSPYSDATIPVYMPDHTEDRVSEQYQSGTGMSIVPAWTLGAGDGVTVGITDTGVDGDPPSEFSEVYFTSGLSMDLRRTISFVGTALGNTFTGYELITGYVRPSCSHGTRIAGLVGAPRNGRSTVGVAYRASIVAVNQADGVIPSGGPAGNAIHWAATHGSRVIVMAWGFPPGETSGYVSDEIDYHYYNDGVVFVGAAGTCPAGSGCSHMESAIFPASKEEVLAVSGANHDGSRPGSMYDWGNKSGIMAYTNLATTGLRRSDLVNLGGSSGATGIVGGIAALVRGRLPRLDPREIMDRLIQTSGGICGAPHSWRESMINASAAAGGPCVSYLWGPEVYYSHDANYPSDNYPRDAWVLVARSLSSGVWAGGSGSYRVEWLAGREAISQQPRERDIANLGGQFWESLRAYSFLPAYDGLPYSTTITAKVYDTQFGTVDERKLKVVVCASRANCDMAASRRYPEPPLAGVAILAPTTVASGASCPYSVSVGSGTASFTYSWMVYEASPDGDGSQLAASLGGGPDNAITFTNDGVNYTLKATVTDAYGAQGTASTSVAISTTRAICLTAA